MPALLLLWGGRSGGRLIIIVLENTPFLRDCCLYLAPFPPNWLKTIWIFLITSLHTAALSLPSPREICKSRTETEADTFLFPFSVHEFEAVLLLCTSAGAKNTKFPHSLSVLRSKTMKETKEGKKNTRWKEEGKTLIKTSSAGICCVTAVYIFTQACIIMVCLVCRSSQKLFRSPGVWKAFKHFIRISPLW